MLLVDELFYRRGRLVLEDIYLFSGKYGPLKGFTLSAVLALCAGTVFVPALWLPYQGEIIEQVPQIASLFQGPNVDLVMLGMGALLAAVAYLALVPGERWLALHWRRRNSQKVAPKDQKRKRKARKRLAKETEPMMLSPDDSRVSDRTSPHYEYNDDDKADLRAKRGAKLGKDKQRITEPETWDDFPERAVDRSSDKERDFSGKDD